MQNIIIHRWQNTHTQSSSPEAVLYRERKLLRVPVADSVSWMLSTVFFWGPLGGEISPPNNVCFLDVFHIFSPQKQFPPLNYISRKKPWLSNCTTDKFSYCCVWQCVGLLWSHFSSYCVCCVCRVYCVCCHGCVCCLCHVRFTVFAVVCRDYCGLPWLLWSAVITVFAVSAVSAVFAVCVCAVARARAQHAKL